MSDASSRESSEGDVTPPKAAPSIPQVTECGLELERVRLVRLICQPGPEPLLDEPSCLRALLNPTAELAQECAFPTAAFEADVSWIVEFDADPPPIRISGVHRLRFRATKKDLSEPAVDYYAQINSVILAYPYLRQLVDDICMRCLGQGIAINPLDVPSFVRSGRAEWLKKFESPQTGAETNVEDAAQ